MYDPFPQNFLTNSDLSNKEIYLKAIEKTGAPLRWSDTNHKGEEGQGSVWKTGPTDPDLGLTLFWQEFDKIKLDMQTKAD